MCKSEEAAFSEFEDDIRFPRIDTGRAEIHFPLLATDPVPRCITIYREREKEGHSS